MRGRVGRQAWMGLNVDEGGVRGENKIWDVVSFKSRKGGVGRWGCAVRLHATTAPCVLLETRFKTKEDEHKSECVVGKGMAGWASGSAQPHLRIMHIWACCHASMLLSCCADLHCAGAAPSAGPPNS